MKISYCTVCGNRLWQLKQTIDHNLTFTKINEFELCILVYNDEATSKYLHENYQEYILDGRLKVKEHQDNYIPKDGSNFACGYVKNLSHAMGSGLILFNLDADNFIGDTHGKLLQLQPNQVLKNIAIGDGRSGRIGVYADMYNKVNGYKDVGRRDDGDFIHRCLEAKAKLVLVDCDIAPIANTN